ncbi:MAG: hypothetical protein O3A00_04350 [Planctomycetota bacterium]|nr:hypothetical protein [Planctomycetota bacterium]
MNHGRNVFAAVLMLIVGANSANAGDEPQFGKFSNILRKGQAIYLRVSPNNPFYTVQLLSDEQAAQVRQTQIDTTANLKRLDEVAAKLKTERKLDVRAALILKQDQLESDISRARMRSRSTLSTFYEVQWAAADYVAIKREGIVKYIPFRSITSIEKREKLLSDRTPADRGFSSASPEVVSAHRVRLQFLNAAILIEVIKKSFAGEKFEIEADKNVNAITFKALPLVARRIERLVQRLDIEIED